MTSCCLPRATSQHLSGLRERLSSIFGTSVWRPTTSAPRCPRGLDHLGTGRAHLQIRYFDLGADLRRLPASVIPGYTQGMKTAISIPDETFDEAEPRAAA